MAVSGQCRASDPRLLEQYDKLKEPNDPDMPCLRTPCPCYTAEDLENLDPPFVTCQIDEPIGSTILRSTVRNFDNEFAEVEDWISPLIADRCFLTYFDDVNGTTISRVIELRDDTELAFCKDLLDDYIDDNEDGCPDD